MVVSDQEVWLSQIKKASPCGLTGAGGPEDLVQCCAVGLRDLLVGPL